MSAWPDPAVPVAVSQSGGQRGSRLLRQRGGMGHCPLSQALVPAAFRCRRSASRSPLPWDRPQLWKPGRNPGNCLSPTRDFPLGRAGPSRRGISPSSSSSPSPPTAVSQSDPSPAGKSPSASRSAQHTPCLRESLLLGAESPSREVSGSCPVPLPTGADGAVSRHRGQPRTPQLPPLPASRGSSG